jgi:hypothetical protein
MDDVPVTGLGEQGLAEGLARVFLVLEALGLRCCGFGCCGFGVGRRLIDRQHTLSRALALVGDGGLLVSLN